MDHELLERKFARIGARVRVHCQQSGGFTINIRRDQKGEYFDIRSQDNLRSKMDSLYLGQYVVKKPYKPSGRSSS